MKSCAQPGCDRPSRSLGLCVAHYGRHRRGQDMTKPLKRARGTGTVNRNGYVARWDGSRLIFEHRLVMEAELGRALLPGETVHHINGVRDDNRPENLELWASNQPPGQRVDDLVAWAREILRRYAP